MSFLEIEIKNISRILGMCILIFGCITHKIIINKNKKINFSSGKYIFLITIIFIAQFLYGVIDIEGIYKYISIYLLIIISFSIIPYYANIIGVKKTLYINLIAITSIMLYSYIKEPNKMQLVYDLSNIPRERYVGIFSHPNHLGGLMLVGILTSIYIIYEYKNMKVIPLIIIFIYILLKTDSRTSLYCLIIFNILILLLYIKLKISSEKFYIIRRIIFVFSIVLLFIFGFSYTLSILYNNYDNLISKLNVLTNGRIFSMLNLMSLSNNKILGNGLISNNNLDLYFGKTIDSSYFLMYYQIGIFGILIILIFLAMLYVKMTSVTKKQLIYVNSLFIIFLIYSFFENSLINYISIFGSFFYSFLGILSMRNEEIIEKI
jgi:hypothetical protein